MSTKNTGTWKTCARGHKFRGPGPCPICWKQGRRPQPKRRRPAAR